MNKALMILSYSVAHTRLFGSASANAFGNITISLKPAKLIKNLKLCAKFSTISLLLFEDKINGFIVSKNGPKSISIAAFVFKPSCM